MGDNGKDIDFTLEYGLDKSICMGLAVATWIVNGSHLPRSNKGLIIYRLCFCAVEAL